MALLMAYALLLATLLGIAAAGFEAALRAWRVPARWAVAAGILGSVLTPLLAFVHPGSLGAATGRVSAVLGGTVDHALARLASPKLLASLDTPLAVLWALSALAILIVATVSHLRLRRLVGQGTQADFEGTPYRRTPDFGPAVVGFVPGVIVLPSWAANLDAAALRLALRHEREHMRAKDPMLQLGGVLLAALQPWNVALWWQVRRLRRAIEVDCDRRLLRSGVDLRAYARLLCTVAERGTSGTALALALGAPRSSVARRVEGFADFLSARRVGRGSVGAAWALLLAVLALQIPSPRAAPAAMTRGTPRALLMFALPGDSARAGDLMTIRLKGEDAVRLIQSMPGAPRVGGTGRVVRRIIRSDLAGGGTPPPADTAGTGP